MVESLIPAALRLVLFLSVPILLASLCAALVGGVVRVVTQIEDPALGFVLRLIAVGLALYLFSGTLSGQVVAFAEGLWGRPDLYR